jgi:ABC-2 type transport system ATP-binding protein
MKDKAILHINNLCKELWGDLILDNVNINIESGCVYWFLGPNWAWKSTTLKILCWLLKKNSWDIEFFWESWKLDNLKKVWALIEKPCLYEHLNWRDNLRIHALLTNTKKSRIQEVLDIVWLDTNAAKKLTKVYSLWMKQRLAIAITLLADPEFIILDEPTNWLDIEGIRDIRELIIKLWKLSYTVLVSSHQLDEIAKACTHIWVIVKWKMRFEWTIDDFKKKWTDIEDIFLSIVHSDNK